MSPIMRAASAYSTMRLYRYGRVYWSRMDRDCCWSKNPVGRWGDHPGHRIHWGFSCPSWSSGRYHSRWEMSPNP